MTSSSKIEREAKAHFEAFLRGPRQRSLATADALGGLFIRSASGFPQTPEKYVEVLDRHVGAWLRALTPAETARFEPKIRELLASLEKWQGLMIRRGAA